MGSLARYLTCVPRALHSVNESNVNDEYEIDSTFRPRLIQLMLGEQGVRVDSSGRPRWRIHVIMGVISRSEYK